MGSTYFPVSLVLYLKLVENIEQMHEDTFFACCFIEMKLITSLF